MWEPVVGLLGMHCEALLCLIVNVLTASGRTATAYDRIIARLKWGQPEKRFWSIRAWYDARAVCESLESKA